MKKILYTIACTVCLISKGYAMIDLNKYSEKIYQPIAVINQIIVSENDLRQKTKMLEISGMKLPRDEILQQLINEKVILLSYNKKISDEFINNTIEKLAADNKLSIKELYNVLNQSQIESNNFRQHIKAQIILHEMINEKIQELNNNTTTNLIFSQTLTTKNTIHNHDNLYLKPIIEHSFKPNSQVKIAEMFVQQKPEIIQKIIHLLKNGSNFQAIQKQFPQAVTLTNSNGVIGWITFSDMSQPYQEAIKNTHITGITEPLISNDGILFIQLLEVKNTKTTQKFIHPEYVKLSYDEKSKMLLQNTQVKMIVSNLVNNLRKQFYIKIF